MFVTVELLDELEACQEERDRFAKIFPRGVELTRELIVQHAQDFDWCWCAKNLASPAGLAAYRRAEEQAWAVYWWAEKQAEAAYHQAIEPAMATYRRAEKQADAAYWQAVEPAYAAYRQAADDALATLKLARANAFADAMGL